MSKTQQFLKETVDLVPREMPVRKAPVLPKPEVILETISDFYLLYPFANTKEAAEFLGYKPRFISMVKNSDAFKTYHLPRAKAHQAELTANVAGLTEKLAGVVEQTVEILSDKIADYDPELNPMPVSEMLDVIETGMKRLGYGEKAAPPTQVQINFGMVDKKILEDARSKMHEVYGRPSAQGALIEARLATELPPLDAEILPPATQVVADGAIKGDT